jgi:beta-hydroxyacyl-ACP dehydratase FabZ
VESKLSTRDILELLPHRYPFLLVDKVISLYQPEGKSRVGQKIVALKNVTANEPFFPGHFPGLPIMPGVLQIEAMAQAACLAFIRKDDPPLDFFIASIQEAKFRRPVVPGDTLMLHAEIVRDRGSILMVRTEAKVDGQVVAEANILAKCSPKSERENL